MNTIILPENVEIRDDNYYNILRGLIYAVDKFGIDTIIEDLEQLQEETKHEK